MALRGLEARQLAFSYAYAFSDKTFSIGITAKIIQGAAYNGSTDLQGGSGVSTTDHFGKPNISTTYGIDLGAIYRPILVDSICRSWPRTSTSRPSMRPEEAS